MIAWMRSPYFLSIFSYGVDRAVGVVHERIITIAFLRHVATECMHHELKPLPAITGPVTVSFKHGDSTGGMALGPWS